jgi:DNA helicase HerA-like ATPase
VSLAAVARAEEDETVKNLLRAVHHTQDPEIAQDAAEYISNLAIEQVLEPDPFAPPVKQEETEGEIVLGQIKNAACMFGLFLWEMVQHILIVGRSGSGKTTLVKRIISQLLLLGRNPVQPVKILVFDIKRDFVQIPQAYPYVWSFRLPGEGFRWNPLEPPFGDCVRWAAILASVFANAVGFYQGMGTENFIYRCLLGLYKKYDVARGIYPCLLDLLDYLRWMKFNKKVEQRTEEYTWFIRFMNRVESLCNSLVGTIDCSRGYPLAKLLKNHVIFDMAGLKQDAQSFFTETFLTQAVWYRIEKTERGGVLLNLAVFDEGKRLMPKHREESQQCISNMSNIVALSREFGIGLVVAECDPALMGNSIKSNCYARFCFNQTSGRDIDDSAQTLGLRDAEQVEEIQRLEVGEAIVRLSGRIKRPFVIRVIL